MASKLNLFNAALREIGETKLASLVEARGPRYALDDVYDDALLYCLEQGQWNFAMRTVEIESAPAIDPTFGFTYAFEKPDDWIRTCGLSASDTMNIPLERYEDEGAYWYADVDPIYVRYVSSDSDYGLDLTLWPATFQRYVELYLASRIAKPTADNESVLERIQKDMKKALIDARSKDAMNEAVRFAPPGSWVQARGNGYKKYNRA